MSGFDADRLNLGPVILEILAENVFLLVVEIREKKRKEFTGALLKAQIMRRIERCDHGFKQMHLRVLP